MADRKGNSVEIVSLDSPAKEPEQVTTDGNRWKVTPEKVELAIKRLVQAGRPRKIILFGSYVRGASGRNSDLDIMVISSDEVKAPRRESVRLRRALRGLSMSMDIIVVPLSEWERFKDRPGMIHREANTSGRIVYEA